jgi:hypothetical protein
VSAVLDAPNVVPELDEIIDGLKAGRLVPYLAPETVLLESSNAWLPARPEQLIERLSKRVPIPGRLRKSLSGAAQYIETFRHRKVLRTLMCEAFAQPAIPSVLHAWLASLKPALIVDLGYDGATATALAGIDGLAWGQVQGVSRAESRAGQGVDWFASYDAAGHPCADAAAAGWQTVLYKPLGSIVPVGNFLVSDADFVEVLTEIDVQTPIPPEVQARRAERGFVFMGCRFDTQHNRTWVRQVMKRSTGPHFALIGPEEVPLTKNELRFVEEQAITVLPASLKNLLARVA